MEEKEELSVLDLLRKNNEELVGEMLETLKILIREDNIKYSHHYISLIDNISDIITNNNIEYDLSKYFKDLLESKKKEVIKVSEEKNNDSFRKFFKGITKRL